MSAVIRAGIAALMKAERIPGGLSSGKPDSDFDPEALAEGIKVEMEHTADRAVAKEITKDHLTEDKEYYKKLRVIEKGDGDEFRGGDPEELQRKKEEKRQEQQDAGGSEGEDLIRAMMELTKAESGSEAGEFRGGDPEELQRKREEKREETAESGEAELQDEEAAMQTEEAGGESALAEEAAMAAEEEGEATGKSAGPFAAMQVSPVDTLEDYRPRTNNGDPLDEQPNQPLKDIDPAPVRDAKTKHLPWSEVVGFKVPKEGAPWQYLRRFILSGQPEKVAEESAKILKSFDAAEEAFFRLYKCLQGGVTFDPHYQILEKAHKGEVVPGHKYIYREMDTNGGWKYTYTNGIHATHHGIEHTGHGGGHTVEAHPDWHGDAVPTGNDPKLDNPEGAFHHAREEQLKEGGRVRVNIKDPNAWNDEKQDFDDVPHIIHMPGATKKGKLTRSPLELHADPTGGAGEDLDKIELGKETKVKRGPSNWENYEEHIRKNHVNTEFDIQGNPYMQYMEPKARAEGEGETTRSVGDDDAEILKLLHEGGVKKRSDLTDFRDPDQPKKKGRSLTAEDFDKMGVSREEAFKVLGERSRAKGEQRGRLRVRYMPHSQHAQEVKRGGKTIAVGDWHQGSENVKAFQNKMRKEKLDQLREADLDGGDKKKRLPKPRVGSEYAYTNKVEQDELPRKRVDMPYRAPSEQLKAGEEGEASTKRQGQHRAWQVQWKDKKEQVKFINQLTKEHEGLSKSVGAYLIDYLVNKKRPGKMYRIRGDLRERIVDGLTERTLTRAVSNAVHSYNPRSGKRFSTYLFNAVMSGQKRVLKDVINTYENVEMGDRKTVGGEAGQKAAEKQQATNFAIGAGTGAPDADPEQAKAHADKELERLQHMGREMHNLMQMYQKMPPSDAMTKTIKNLDSKLASIVSAGKELAQVKTALVQGEGHPVDVNDWHDKWSDPRNGLTEDAQNPILTPPPHSDETYRHITKKLAKGKKVEKAVAALTKAQLGFPQADAQAQQLDQDEGGTSMDQGETAPGAKEEAGAEEEAEPRQYPDAKYVGRTGEPGAYNYLYEAGEGGNIVHGTNAPADHEHEHIQELGEPSIHEGEPSPETHPNLFDEQGRKLHAPIPPNATDVEDNPNYSPEKVSGNHWVKRYTDPESGSKQYSYLHRDQVTDPKMHRNNSMRYVDKQLPKIRAHYRGRMVSDDPADRAVGLFMALLDQAKLPARALESLEVEDVQINNNAVTFHIGAGKSRVVLDGQAMTVMKELLENKEPNDGVFTANGSGIDLITLNKFWHDQFGVLPTDLEVYNNTELFSREFQKLVQRKDMEYSIRHLQELRHEAANSVAKMTGNDLHSVEANIDPIAVEALFLAAAANRHRMTKSQGACEECGEPKGYCKHTRPKDKLAKGYKLQGRTEFQGLKVSIENKKGSTRKWYDKHNKQSGETKMHFDYGYILGSMGVDGDQVDVYLGPNADADTAYVVHQMKAPDFTKFDEDKVFLGWDDPKQVEKDYRKQYDKPGFFGAVSAVPMEKFITKVKATKERPMMIKAHTWTVSVDMPERTTEEEMFSQWLHEYPLHEHHSHWHGMERATEKDERQDAKINTAGATHAPEMLEEPEVEEEGDGEGVSVHDGSQPEVMPEPDAV